MWKNVDSKSKAIDYKNEIIQAVKNEEEKIFFNLKKPCKRS